LTAQGAEELQSLNAALAGMKEHERRLLRARQQTVERYDALTKYIVLIGTLLGLIITAGAGIGVIRDNQRRRRAEVALYVEKELAQVTLSSIGEGVIRADREGRITFFNRAAELMTGWTAGDALRQPFDTVFSRVDAVTHRPVTSRMQMVLNRGETLRLPDNSVLVRRDGIEIPIEDTVAPIRDLQGNITGAVKIFRDVSDARALTRRLEHSAQHDVLTGRSLLEDRAGQATALAARNAWRCALLFLDLDGFKPVNDRFGHATGDKLLQSVSQRLADCVRDCDTVSRLGGDEFAVLLGQAKDRDDASVTARRILRDVSRPYEIDGVSVHVTTSVGVSMYPEDGEAIDTLLKRADLAMYAAKSSGRNVFAFYGDPDLSAQVIDVGARRA